MSSERRNALVAAALLMLVAAWSATRLRVTTDITHFLPEGRADLDLTLARELAFGELSRTMVLVVRTGDAELAPAISRELEQELLQEPRVAERAAFVEGGPPPGIERALWETYEPRLLAFAATDAARARALITDEGLDEAVSSLREQLGSPMSTLLTRVAPRDPLLILPALLDRMESGRGGGMDVSDGRFVVDAGCSAVLFCATRAPSSDNAEQRPFLQGIRAAFDRVDRRHGGALELEESGSNRYGVRMEESIQNDIWRVTIGSFVLLVATLLLVFGSLRLFVLVLPVFGAGFLGGVAACLAISGEVHGITLAFGSTLIGVGVDYAVHFHCHQVLAPEAGGPRATLRKIWPGLCLGSVTTVVGFLAFVVSTFPGLRELAIFGAAGITAALFATRALLPVLSSHAPRVGASRTVARALADLFWPTAGEGPRARSVRFALYALVALVLAIGLPRARWDDGLGSLSRLDPGLLASDAAVRARVTRFDQRHVVVAVGADEASALEANDLVADALRAARDDGVLAGAWSAAVLLPSEQRQREVDAALRGDASLWPRLRARLESQGFVAESFAPFRDALAAATPAPISWSELASGPLAPLVRPFRLNPAESAEHPEARVAFTSFVRGVEDTEELRRRVESAGGRWIDVEAELTGAFGAYRRRMATLFVFGCLAVVLLVAARQAAARPRRRVLRATAATCLPAILAALVTVAILSLCGESLNLLSLVSLLMVVSMGDDFGIFVVEASDAREDLEATALSVFLAAVTTLYGFGLLAFSEHPALHAMGLTATLGILLSLVFALIMRRVTPTPVLADAPRDERA